jgi:Uma2 family endonuclease
MKVERRAHPSRSRVPPEAYDPTMSISADVRIPMRLLTVDDYERMLDAGILAEGDGVELLKGQLSEVSPQGPQHAALIQWLAAHLTRAIDPAAAAVRVQLPLRFIPVSEPEPDIAVVAAGTYAQAHPAEAMLVIEIAATSRDLDLGTKVEVYAAAAVAEYWVIDVRARTIHVHASPTGSTYGEVRAVSGGGLRSRLAAVPEVDVDALFAMLG